MKDVILAAELQLLFERWGQKKVEKTLRKLINKRKKTYAKEGRHEVSYSTVKASKN
ncbi:hypothetical protein [Thermodesulfovibrio sp.]|uniref:hypothetical protein n=1 Tax=Thermodesulfovibrio sp. TaxID=2067987 RepID=UPI0030AF2E05